MSLTSSLLRLFKHFNQRRRWQLAGLVLLMLVGAVSEMATLGAVVPFLALLADPSKVSNYLMLQTVFSWFGGTPKNMLLSAAVFFCLVTVFGGLLRLLLTWAGLRFSHGIGADLGGAVYLRTLHRPYNWHVSKNTSEILAAIEKVNVVMGAVIVPLTQSLVAAVIAAGLLIMLLTIDSQAALIAGLGFLMVYAMTTMVLRRRLVQNSHTAAKNATKRIQAVQEGLGGIRDVLLDGSQAIYHERFTRFDWALRQAQAANNFFVAAPRYAIEALGMVLIVTLAYWLSVREGGLGGAFPVLGGLAIGAQKLLPQMQAMYSGWASFSGSVHMLHEVLDMIDEPILAAHCQGSNAPQTSSPADADLVAWPKISAPFIALRHVSFCFKPGTANVLQDINLNIDRGARVGIIGGTGSGKSTFIDLVMGLLSPSSGRIEIDGKTLDPCNCGAWKRRIAHVPQAIYLSDATIAQNIAFGIPSAQIDMAQVRLAAQKAQIADFIENLPLKYQTPVGERGVRLSGGQRQRIGLARALHKQADVLIFDEATSALDYATEQLVMNVIYELSKEITIIIIAHRISSLRQCDQIIEFSKTNPIKYGPFNSVAAKYLSEVK